MILVRRDVKAPTAQDTQNQSDNVRKDPIGYFKDIIIHQFIREQDIKKIRSKNAIFRDVFFPAHSKVFGQPNCKFLQEFRQPVRWERTKMISYHSGKNTQFVLDQRGKPVVEYSNLNTDQHFSVGDIFQGSLGSCFLLAALLGLTRNLELIAHVMPIENARQSNIDKGAFNFRFWKLGDWYELVIDDYLVCDANHNVLFTRNLSFKNEYWMCLVEKAFAKYLN